MANYRLREVLLCFFSSHYCIEYIGAGYLGIITCRTTTDGPLLLTIAIPIINITTNVNPIIIARFVGSIVLKIAIMDVTLLPLVLSPVDSLDIFNTLSPPVPTYYPHYCYISKFISIFSPATY